MPTKLTTRDFITNSTTKHGSRYDYSLVEYVNSKTKVQIICSEHGTFEQSPDRHLHGSGCARCKGVAKLDTETFIKRSTVKHDGKYDYSLADYTTVRNKVKIVCPKHGTFLQKAANHLNGIGCPCCVRTYTNIEEFIKRSTAKHGSRYDYSLVEYVDTRTKVKIICSEHGVFLQSPAGHLQSSGCDKCGGRATLDTKTFIKRSTVKHNNTYDYSLVEYVNSKTKVQIICSEHGTFEQTPANHLNGGGCPGCAKTGYDSLKPGRLYYVMFDFGHTILYKIGITNNTVKRRFANERIKPIVLWETTFSNGSIAQKIESDKKKEYSEYLYSGQPLLKCGNTECFTVDIMSFGRSTKVYLDVHHHAMP
jgi:hypothetical protein